MNQDAIAHRVCIEFIEMPGLRLTFKQAVRLLGLPATECRTVVDDLVASGFLRQTRTGMLMRADLAD
jgi:DNA-binding IclR family transcriptional regulator